VDERSIAGLQAQCTNCGTTVAAAYCPRCGQEREAPPAVREFLRESLEHLLSLESRGWRTLRALVFAPGALTSEYLAGRRVRHVRPLRLYLWISVLAIACIETFDLQLGLRFSDRIALSLFDAPRQEASDAAVRSLPLRLLLATTHTPRVQRFATLNATERHAFISAHRSGIVRYFMLFLVPLFALAMQCVYANRARRYAEHLVFCLHVHSFLLLALIVEAFVPGPLATLMSLWILVYYFLAARRVYGGGWGETLLRGGAALALDVGVFVVCGMAVIYGLLEYRPA
jgi:hypothetical protein